MARISLCVPTNAALARGPARELGDRYPVGSTVGVSDDDSPSVATDYGPPANPSPHRWRVNLPSLAGQLVKAGKDWRAYLQNIPESGTHLANWPGDDNTAKLYAVKHNPFPLCRFERSVPRAIGIRSGSRISDNHRNRAPRLSHFRRR